MQEPADRLSWAQKAGNLFFRGAATSTTRTVVSQDDAFMQSRLTDVGIGDWLKNGIKFESLPAHCAHRHAFTTLADQHCLTFASLANWQGYHRSCCLFSVVLVHMQSVLGCVYDIAGLQVSPGTARRGVSRQDKISGAVQVRHYLPDRWLPRILDASAEG